jgi:hypothetical protein
MDVTDLLRAISLHILNPIILALFAIAFIVFAWGVVEFISSETSDVNRSQGKRKIFWGIFGMFVMISAYGLIRLILDTFGITGPSYLGF